MKRLVECVPNFSEGRDPQVIRRITESIESVEGVRLLNVDPGKATNRTVVTFVGEPEAAVEAAFRAIRTAGDLIDMRRHAGAHPRMGATDVCPLVPVAGIAMEETAEFSTSVDEPPGGAPTTPSSCSRTRLTMSLRNSAPRDSKASATAPSTMLLSCFESAMRLGMGACRGRDEASGRNNARAAIIWAGRGLSTPPGAPRRAGIKRNGLLSAASNVKTYLPSGEEVR